MHHLSSCRIPSHFLQSDTSNCPLSHFSISDQICFHLLNFLNFEHYHCWKHLHHVKPEKTDVPAQSVGFCPHFVYCPLHYFCHWRDFSVYYSQILRCRTPLAILCIGPWLTAYSGRHGSVCRRGPSYHRWNRMLGVFHICNGPSTYLLQYLPHFLLCVVVYRWEDRLLCANTSLVQTGKLACLSQ